MKIPPTGIPLEEIERQALVEALKMSNWVQKDAAELLSISPRVMNYKIKTLGIEFRARAGRRPMVESSGKLEAGGGLSSEGTPRTFQTPSAYNHWPLFPAPRVRLPVDLQQLRGVDVRVALRRAQARVPEQLLDRAQVGAALQQVRRERMAQRVRADAPSAARSGDQPIDAATVSAPPR